MISTYHIGIIAIVFNLKTRDYSIVCLFSGGVQISDATFRLAARLALIDELRETAEDSAAEVL